MTDMVAATKPATPKSITTKHLAYELAEQHQLSKTQALEMVENLIGVITAHLKKAERVKIVGLGILQVRIRCRPRRPQSQDWRANPDQGQQKDRLPRLQGTQGSALIVSSRG